jgi:hypothetical protein
MFDLPMICRLEPTEEEGLVGKKTRTPSTHLSWLDSNMIPNDIGSIYMIQPDFGYPKLVAIRITYHNYFGRNRWGVCCCRGVLPHSRSFG